MIPTRLLKMIEGQFEALMAEVQAMRADIKALREAQQASDAPRQDMPASAARGVAEKKKA